MLLDALVLVLLIGLVAGGRLARLQSLELRGTWLFVSAAAARVGLQWASASRSSLLLALGPLLLIASYLALLGALWMNRRIRLLWVAGIGILLNLLVIAANGGSMPAERALAMRAYGPRSPLVHRLDASGYTLHRAATASTRLRFLGDVLPLPMVPPRPRWFCPGSAGDVLITAGACATLLCGMGAFGLTGGPRRARGAAPGLPEARR